MKTACQLFFIYFVVAVPSLSYAQLELEPAFPNLKFIRPVYLEHPGDGSDRLFVVEQQGVIYSFHNARDAAETSVFLDIRDRVSDSGNEEGLLGLAFHPGFKDNGYFFVDYTASNPRRTVISRFSVSTDDGSIADKNSELVLLEIQQPYSNHNGGQIAFGPDGYFYIAMGDGGSGGDPQGNGQNLKTLLGAILRIDVDNPENGNQYGIPENNPFADNTGGYREEIYAYGLRNPWRFSFDPVTGWLWAADVGQSKIEEIDIIEPGKNYGWNIMEGNSCYSPSANCDRTGLELPVWEYDHSSGKSVTGGYVYRGMSVPVLYGSYIYADYVSGIIWSLRYDSNGSTVNEKLLDTGLLISSFGVDADNELYICAFDGMIYRFRPTFTSVEHDNAVPETVYLGLNYPNPFNPVTTISYGIPDGISGYVTLKVFDLRGVLVKTLINQPAGPGMYSVVWDGTDTSGNSVSSSVYIYTIQAGEFTRSNKMILMR